MVCKNNREHQEHAVPETFRIDMSLLLGRVVFVPNCGANIVAALRGYTTRLNCNVHIVLSSAFAPDMLPKTPQLFELLTNAKHSAEQIEDIPQAIHRDQVKFKL